MVLPLRQLNPIHKKGAIKFCFVLLLFFFKKKNASFEQTAEWIIWLHFLHGYLKTCQGLHQRTCLALENFLNTAANHGWVVSKILNSRTSSLKVVSTAFLLVCFLSLKETTCETRKKISIIFTSIFFIFVLKKIKV